MAPRDLVQENPGKCPLQRYGRLKGHLWEQFELPRALDGRVLINLCNSAPITVRRQLVTVHDAAIVDARKGYALSYRTYYRCLYAILRRRVPVFVTVSAWSRSRLIEHFGFPASRVHVIPNGVDHILRVDSDSRILIDTGLVPGGYVLSFASANPNKRTVDIEVLAPELQRLNMRLVFVSGGESRSFRPMATSVEAYCTIRLSGLSDSQLKALYENAAAFVSCSSYEGFGLPPLEACACGIPVIVTDIPSHREILDEAASYFPVGDRCALLRCLQSVLSDRIFATEISAAGAERARQFVWARCADYYRSLAEEIS